MLCCMQAFHLFTFSPFQPFTSAVIAKTNKIKNKT